MIEFFQTDGNKSIIRLCLFIDIVACIIIATLAIILKRDLTGTAALVAALLAPVSIAKAVQSKYED
jgi:hypothetical protein